MMRKRKWGICSEKRPWEDLVRRQLSDNPREKGLKTNQTCQHLDHGFLASRTVGK